MGKNNKITESTLGLRRKGRRESQRAKMRVKTEERKEDKKSQGTEKSEE